MHTVVMQDLQNPPLSRASLVWKGYQHRCGLGRMYGALCGQERFSLRSVVRMLEPSTSLLTIDPTTWKSEIPAPPARMALLTRF